MGFTRFNNGVFYSQKKSTTPLVSSTLGFSIIHYNLNIILYTHIYYIVQGNLLHWIRQLNIHCSVIKKKTYSRRYDDETSSNFNSLLPLAVLLLLALFIWVLLYWLHSSVNYSVSHTFNIFEFNQLYRYVLLTTAALYVLIAS